MRWDFESLEKGKYPTTFWVNLYVAPYQSNRIYTSMSYNSKEQAIAAIRSNNETYIKTIKIELWAE